MRVRRASLSAPSLSQALLDLGSWTPHQNQVRVGIKVVGLTCQSKDSGEPQKVLELDHVGQLWWRLEPRGRGREGHEGQARCPGCPVQSWLARSFRWRKQFPWSPPPAQLGQGKCFDRKKH